MFISVAVPVRNEAAAIEVTLRALLTQDYPPDRFEVIVADGGSDDATVPIVRRLQRGHPNLHLLYNPGRLSSAARNLAAQYAAGDCLLVVDGHCDLPGPGYLRAVADAFACSRADCLGRPQPLRGGGATAFQRAVAAARESRLGHNPDSRIYSDEPGAVPAENVAVAYRRRVFEQVGLFDERFDACEDVEFNTRVDRAGLECFFAPELRIDYHARRSLPALFRQMARYGAGRCRLAFKHRGTLTPAALGPPLFLLGLAAGPVAACLSEWAASAYLACVVLYAAAVLAASVSVSRPAAGVGGSRRAGGVSPPAPETEVSAASRPSLALLPAVFAAIHLGFGWGFLRELARRLREPFRPGEPEFRPWRAAAFRPVPSVAQVPQGRPAVLPAGRAA